MIAKKHKEYYNTAITALEDATEKLCTLSVVVPLEEKTKQWKAHCANVIYQMIRTLKKEPKE